MIGNQRWRISVLGCAALVFVLVGCRPVPTAPETDGVIDRTYSNADWGFSISAPPDSAWSLSATQFIAQREPNGLSPVQVILRRINPGSPSRPVLLLSSFGVSQTTLLDDVVASFESLFATDFLNYNPQGPKSERSVGGVPSIEWRFFAREPQSGIHYLNNRFLSFVFLRDNQIYQVICSAQAEEFPESEFRSILSTFEFQ